MDFFKNLFVARRNKKPSGNDFSDFFVHAKSDEKAKVIRSVLREANTEQREMVRKYKNEMGAT